MTEAATQASEASGPNRRNLLKWAGALGLLAAGGGFAYKEGVLPGMGSRTVSPAFCQALCRLVLPATTTPGAAEAGVPEFLPIAFDHGLFGGDADTLGNLADALDQRVTVGDFEAASAEDQLKALTALDTETYAKARAQGSATSAAADAPEKPPENLDTKHWRTVKNAIVSSYYTTEIGGAQELHFDLAPGDAYRADVAIGDVKYLSNFWLENIF